MQDRDVDIGAREAVLSHYATPPGMLLREKYTDPVIYAPNRAIPDGFIL
jgi:hypothetical protein